MESLNAKSGISLVQRLQSERCLATVAESWHRGYASLSWQTIEIPNTSLMQDYHHAVVMVMVFLQSGISLLSFGQLRYQIIGVA